jgi:MFS family permease
LLFHGAVVDRLYRRGVHDAHMAYMAVMCLIAAPAAFFAYRCTDPWSMLALYAVFYFCVMGFASIGPAALQIVMPARLRGLATGFFMVVLSFFGTATGPYLVAAINQYGFRSLNGAASSLSIFGGLSMVAAALTLAAGRAGMRAIPANAEAS